MGHALVGVRCPGKIHWIQSPGCSSRLRGYTLAIALYTGKIQSPGCSRLRGTAPIKARCKCPPQKAFHGIRHFQMGLATISASARLDHGLLQQDVAELFQSQCSLPWSHLTKNLFRKCTDFEHSCGRKSKSNIAGFP